MANLRLFTALWGDEKIEEFEKGPLKSLLWPKNKAVIDGSTWDVWTYEPHVEHLERLLFNSFDIKFEAHILPTIYLDNGRMAPPPYLLHQPIQAQMVTCLNTVSKLLMIPPDTVFGEGTLANIMKLGELPGTCVAVPHMRVYQHALHHIGAEPISNSKLCNIAFETMHPSWISSEKDVEGTCSFWSGVRWEKLEEKLWSITHRIPTIYLASFTGHDHAFWQSQAAFGGWDHRWPGECLIRQGRQRMPGSSDACMIVEITGPGDNIPPKTPPEALQQFPPDAYWVDTLHAEHNRQIQFIMRGE